MVDSMGLTPREKAELAAYQLKVVAHVWFEKWRSKRPLERELVDSEESKEDFLDRFFPLEWREKKMVEFENLRQWGISCARVLSQIHPTLQMFPNHGRQP